MSDAWTLFLFAAFVDNMPLTLFLSLCTFLALWTRPESTIGLGVAMTGVLGVTVPLNPVKSGSARSTPAKPAAAMASSFCSRSRFRASTSSAASSVSRDAEIDSLVTHAVAMTRG